MDTAVQRLASPPGLAFPDKDLVTISHRGEWRVAPENSVAAIEAAVVAGADIVEIDVRRLADGTLVVMHDDTLERTSDGAGRLAEKTFADLAGLRLRAGAGGPAAAVTGETIPLLSEALEAARGRIAVNIDLKDPADYAGAAALAVDLAMADQVIFKGDVDPDAPQESLARFPGRERFSFMPMMRARSGRLIADIEAVAAFSPAMIELKFDDLAEVAGARESLSRHGIRLWVNTLDVSYNLDFSDSRALADPDGVWGRLIEAGVGAIQTDRVPELLGWHAGRRGERRT